MSGESRFELLEELGSGTYSTVHRAKEIATDRIVALKRIKPEYLRDRETVRRFEREVFAVASITSPHVVALYDFQISGDDFFIAMEPVDGFSLREAIAHRAWNAQEIFQLVAQIAEALSAAHKLGIVHRDLKPENIMLARVPGEEEAYRIKVLDFGFAKAGDLESKLELSILTRLGTTLGTPQYMAPEQCGGKPLQPATDLFALGVIVYELLSGAPPWDHRQPFDTMTAVVNAPPPPLKKQPSSVHRAVGRYKELASFFEHALSKRPEDRPRDADAFVHALGEALFPKHEYAPLAKHAEGVLRVDAPTTLPPRESWTGGAIDRTTPIDASAFLRTLERSGALIISADETTRAHWTNALSSLAPVSANHLDAAKEILARRRFEVVLLDLLALPSDASLDGFGDEPIILLASYDELARVVQQRLHEQVAHVFPRSGTVDNLRRLIERVRLGGGDIESPPVSFDENAALSLLRKTVALAVRIPGAVIRPLDLKDRLEIQLVIPMHAALETFHRSLPLDWGWPIARQDSPAVRAFGPLDDDQDLFLRTYAIHGVERAVHIALLPWKSEDHLTIILGVYSPDERERHVELVRELHALACREIGEFILTRRPARAPKTVYHSVRYDWVVTDRYVGPDRRKQDTSLLNRFVVFGRRQLLADQLVSRSGGFIDRFPRWSRWYLACFLFLSMIDTAFTFWFVGKGVVHEVNPLLRPLLAGHPYLFLLTKNVFAFLALFLVLRLHLFRVARYLLPGTLAVYFCLDVYWLWLLVSKHAFG